MKLFNEVVSQPSVFDRLVSTLARLVFPGVGNLSPFAGFDVWTERGPRSPLDGVRAVQRLLP